MRETEGKVGLGVPGNAGECIVPCLVHVHIHICSEQYSIYLNPVSYSTLRRMWDTAPYCT